MLLHDYDRQMRRIHFQNLPMDGYLLFYLFLQTLLVEGGVVQTPRLFQVDQLRQLHLWLHLYHLLQLHQLRQLHY